MKKCSKRFPADAKAELVDLESELDNLENDKAAYTSEISYRQQSIETSNSLIDDYRQEQQEQRENFQRMTKM